jgi:iron complex transport system substrate-binding protein
MTALTGQPEWADLQAVKAGRVFIVDGNQYFNRPGPRLAESARILAELFHPTLFAPNHRDTGWVPFAAA